MVKVGINKGIHLAFYVSSMAHLIHVDLYKEKNKTNTLKPNQNNNNKETKKHLHRKEILCGKVCDCTAKV